MMTIQWNWTRRLTQTLREKYPYSELFWSVFSCIRTEYGEIRMQSKCRKIRTRITPNTDTFHAVRIFIGFPILCIAGLENIYPSGHFLNQSVKVLPWIEIDNMMFFKRVWLWNEFERFAVFSTIRLKGEVNFFIKEILEIFYFLVWRLNFCNRKLLKEILENFQF